MKGSTWVWVLVIVLVLALIGGGIYWWWSSNQKTAETTGGLTATSTATAKVAEKWTRSGKTVFNDVTSSDTHKLSDGTYRMYFMKDDGIVYADSSDAATFTDPVQTGIKSDPGKFISNPAVLQIKDGEWLMAYEQQPMSSTPGQSGNQPPSAGNQRNLYYATSSDGKVFSKGGVAIDSSKEDDFFTSVPDLVLLSGGKVRMYYVSGGEAIGSAISSDSGKTWQRETGLRLEDKAVDPDVMQKGNEWVMYFSVLSGPGNSLYKSTSKDGLTWTGKQEVLSAQDQETAIVDPDVVEISTGKYRMFFGEAGGGSPGQTAPMNLSYADSQGDLF